MPALATWTPEDGLLGALAPLGLAASQTTALVVDLDESGPSYPGAGSLAALVSAGPRRADLVPARRGLAVLRNGGIAFDDAREVVEALIAGWPRVVLRLPAAGHAASGVCPVVPVRPLLPGHLFSHTGPAVYQRAGWRVPRPSRRAVAAATFPTELGSPAAGPGAGAGPMGEGMEAGLGAAVDLIDRLVNRLVESAVPLERAELESAALALLDDEAPLASPSVVDQAVDALVGLGPIEPLLREPDISDILVNGPDEVWVERGGDLELSGVAFASDVAVIAAVERVISPLGLRLDRASPAVDARLADGSRLHAVVPPVSVDGPVVAIRRFTQMVSDLAGMVQSGSIDDRGAAILAAAVEERRNLIVSGGTGSGKTTLLGVLSGLIPEQQRVVTVEDAAELRMQGHVVRLESRPPNAEGAGEVTLRTLVRHALRLRPDRIIVGEVRGPEALDMIQAMNTGHAGSMSTIHANSPDDALWRLETLALSGDARVPEQAIRRQIRSSVDLVVQTERRSGARKVVAIAAVHVDSTEELYRC